MTQEKIKNVIQKEFDIGNLLVFLIKESSDNILYKIITETKNYVLRISKRDSISENNIMFELEAMRIANEGGVKTVQIVKSKLQNVLVKYEENFLVLFEYIDGIHIDYSEKLELNLGKVFNAGKTLASLHNIWENSNIKFSKTRNMFTEYERFFKNKNFFITNFLNGQKVFDLVENTYKELKNENIDEIIHNDFRPHNIFFSKNKSDNEILAVLDFDWACGGNFLKDLAHSIVEWSLSDGSIDIKFNIAQTFLDGYLSVRKIEIDIKKLKEWMIFSCISDALTYWIDRKASLTLNTELYSFMFKKALKVIDGQFDKLMLTENRPYLYLDGLKNLANDLIGNEKIHVGIRPYGFHAGNVLTIISYPKILCEEFKIKHDKEPEFNFILSINDWEQDALDGPDYKKFPFNIYPKNTSIQMIHSDASSSIKMTDYWEPIIENVFKYSLRDFPNLKINLFRNSSLKNTPAFKELLIETIKNPKKQYEIYKQYSKFEFLDSPILYGGVICTKCTSSHGFTNIYNDKILWKCIECGISEEKNYEEYEYWWYHKTLLVARMKHFKFDVLLSGGDHFNENDFQIRQALFREFIPEIKIPKMFFGAIVLSNIDGKRMSKSKDNSLFVDIEKLYDVAKNNYSESILINEEIILNLSNEEYKKYCDNL